jgi:hypothetical protein
VHGKDIRLSLLEGHPHFSRTIQEETLEIQSRGNIHSFLVPLDNQGGNSFFGVQWDITGEDLEGIIAPVSKYTLNSSRVNDEINAAFFPEDEISSEKIHAAVDSADHGDSILDILFLADKDNLVIVSRAGSDVTIALDPANSKTGFPVFSNRFIRLTDEDDDKNTFYYLQRSFSQEEKEIEYTEEQWHGEMESSREYDLRIITIPWHNLGIDFQPGRRIGFSVFGEYETFPARANKFIPGTWHNLRIE